MSNESQESSRERAREREKNPEENFTINLNELEVRREGGD